jgi:tRNA(Ile)-lysidine synthase
MAQSSSDDLAALARESLARAGVLGQPILVAVSGGPDSLALLHLLRGLAPVQAAHFNHGLRGEESDADEAFVRRVCESWQVPVHTTRRAVAQEAQAAHANLEAYARMVRYAWLVQTARRCQLPVLATGHTRDDQVETILFHVFRGTGLRGLRGIAPHRPLGDGLVLVRPLLEASRQEVMDYLSKHGLTARQDSSNVDLRWTRNWLRLRLLPLLRERFADRCEKSLLRLAEEAREILAEQQRRVRTALVQAELPRAGQMVVLDAQRLAPLGDADLGELFTMIWEREGWPRGRLTRKHLRVLARLLRAQRGSLYLPEGVRASRRGKVLRLFRDPFPTQAEGSPCSP